MPYIQNTISFHRLAKIPYKNVYTLKMNNRGQTPYIELNGEQYPDSNLIIDMLKEKFNVNLDKDLSEVRRNKYSTIFYSYFIRYIYNYYSYFNMIAITHVLYWL